MISRQYRFHGRASIQRLYRNSQQVRADSLSLRYAPNPRRSHYRLAVVVSRKVSKSAVVRNRIRRRLYEQVRVLYDTSTTAHDLLIVVHDDATATADAAVVREEVIKLLKKAKLTVQATPVRAIVESKEMSRA